MKALTIMQPWANGIAIGEKIAEIRTWKTNYRGPILIHASQTIQSNDEAFAFINALYRKYKSQLTRAHAQPCGCFVAMAELVDCVPALSVPDIRKKSGGINITKDDWAFMLENVEPLHPYEYKGKLMLWDVSEEVVLQLRYTTTYGYANNVLHLYPKRGLL